MNKFNCTGCGECCKNVGAIRDDNGLPMFDTKKDGKTCIFLVENQCSIYEFRPEICRVDEIHAKYFPDMPYKEFHNTTAFVCNELIKNTGLDLKYLVEEI